MLFGSKNPIPVKLKPLSIEAFFVVVDLKVKIYITLFSVMKELSILSLSAKCAFAQGKCFNKYLAFDRFGLNDGLFFTWFNYKLGFAFFFICVIPETSRSFKRIFEQYSTIPNVVKSVDVETIKKKKRIILLIHIQYNYGQ